MAPSACYANVHREVTGQDPAVQTDVSSKATNQAVSRGFPYKKLEVGTSHRPVIGFCDTRENTWWSTIKDWNVAILRTVAAFLEQKSPAVERAARPHNNCLWPDYRINPSATSNWVR